MYEIRRVSDMLAGTSLIVTIEESELDKKALYTIQESKPGFILPFRTRYVDGKVEFTYQTATLCNLQYIIGNCTVREYVQLWGNILSPLLECDDWFMKIQSFVLEAGHLYYDKDLKSVSFVYIPTLRDFSEYEDLKRMAGELVKQISVTDMALENKALRLIMNDFKPKEFLDMLNEYISEADRRAAVLTKNELLDEVSHAKPSLPVMPLISHSLKEFPTKPYASEPADPRREDKGFAVFEAGSDDSKDIIINLPSGDKGKKRLNEKKNFLSKKEKKDEKKAKGKKGRGEKERGGKERYGKEKGGKETNENIKTTSDSTAEKSDCKTSPDDDMLKGFELAPMREMQPMQEAEPYDDATQCVRVLDSECMLRLIGNPLLPSLIKIEIEDGELFTIGRYDATVGRQQSSFEFERKTKAISRRHAAIKRHSESYSLIDLSSSAGTYLDGLKLPPNTPLELKRGTRISFGTCGADYVFDN